MAKKCFFIKEDKSQCNAYPQTGKDYCYLHDPEKAAERAVVVKKGGLANKLEIGFNKRIIINRPHQIHTFLVRVANMLKAGEISPAESNAFCYLGNTIMKNLELINQEERIKKLEEGNPKPEVY